MIDGKNRLEKCREINELFGVADRVANPQVDIIWDLHREYAGSIITVGRGLAPALFLNSPFVYDRINKRKDSEGKLVSKKSEGGLYL